MRRRISWLALLGLVIVLGAIGAFVLPRAITIMRINSAQEQWQAAQIDHYRMELISASAWSMITVELEINDGQVVSSSCTPEGMANACERVDFQRFSVPNLFDRAQKDASFTGNFDMDGNIFPCFSAEVDPSYHYPSMLSFDCPDTLDEQWVLRVLSFEPIE
jgi:hypothetical protein